MDRENIVVHFGRWSCDFPGWKACRSGLSAESLQHCWGAARLKLIEYLLTLEGHKKARGTSFPFLACLWWKISVSALAGGSLQMNGESTTRRCGRGTTRECRWISSTLITSGPSDQGRKSWIVLGAGKLNITVLFWGMSKMILFWETSSWWLITLGWASPFLVKTCFVQNESDCDDKVPQVIIFEGQATCQNEYGALLKPRKPQCLVIIAVDSRYYMILSVWTSQVFESILPSSHSCWSTPGANVTWIIPVDQFLVLKGSVPTSTLRQVPCRAWSGHAWGTGAADKQTGERLLNVVSANTVSENGGISPAGKPGLHKISI